MKLNTLKNKETADQPFQTVDNHPLFGGGCLFSV